MKKRALGALLAVSMVATLLVGCGKSDSSTQNSTKGTTEETTEEATTDETQKPEKYGIVIKVLSSEFWQSMKTGIENKAKELGVEVEVLAANSEDDVEGQVTVFESMIQSGEYCAFGVAPLSDANLVNTVVEANEAGYLVANIDEQINPDILAAQGGSVVCFVTTDNKVVGKATPKFSGGFINNFTFKGFSLNINTNYVYGNKIFNYNRLQADGDGAYLGYNQMSLDKGTLGWNRWREPGDIATHPRAVMNGNKGSNNISSRFLENGSFFRLKNVTLGYNLPKSVLKSVAMSNCRIYISGDNLLTFTKFAGMDPEVSLKTTEYSLAGLYSDNYPISSQVLVGVEISF